MEGQFHINSSNRFCCTLETSHILWHSFFTFFKFVEITIVQMLRVSGGWMNIFHLFFHEKYIEEFASMNIWILLWECILKLFIVWILSHMTHVLKFGSTRRPSKPWIKHSYWDLSWVYCSNPIISGPSFKIFNDDI
jgi:hypothetical protein